MNISDLLPHWGCTIDILSYDSTKRRGNDRDNTRNILEMLAVRLN
jgi:hypothetical protein